MAQQQLREESNRRARCHDDEDSEKVADEILSQNPKDLHANRIKARACLARRDMKRAFQFARKGIPIGENGVPLVAFKHNGEVDVFFAKILRDMYIDEGRLDEAIKCMEQYAEYFPDEKEPKHKFFLMDLQELKSKKSISEKNAEDMMKAEDRIKDENEKRKERNRKKKEKKKKKKNKIETSSSGDTKEEKESIESKAKDEGESNTALEAKNEHQGKKRHADEEDEEEIDYVRYQISKKRKNDIFIGSMGSCDYDMESNSFIPATSEQLNNYDELKNLGSSHGGILYVQRKIYRVDLTVHLLVERVHPLDSIFEKLMNSVPNLDKHKWWNLIENLFKRIFSEIVETLQFLYSKKKVCGNLLFGLYVTTDERPKLLPSMDRRGTRVEDFKQLVEKMKGIIGMPFNELDVAYDAEFGLPASLATFLVGFNYSKPEVIPWVLKSPFFWTIKEEFRFLDGVLELIRSLDGFKAALKSHLDNYPEYLDYSWSDTLDGRYRALWEKGNPQNVSTETVPPGCFRVNPYKSSDHIYRYLCAAKKHINEQEYKNLDSGDCYDEAKKASDIKFFFPMIYVDSHLSLYYILCANLAWLDRFMDIF